MHVNYNHNHKNAIPHRPTVGTAVQIMQTPKKEEVCKKNSGLFKGILAELYKGLPACKNASSKARN